jgi:hypothetical protein
MHMNIFDNDAFSAVTMTTAIEDFDFTPSFIGSLNLFEDVPTTTEMVSVERRGNSFSIIPTTERGAPLPEGKTDGRIIRGYGAPRIAKGHTLQASAIQGIREFGTEQDLQTMISYVGRFESKLITEVEMTWENMMLGAVTGVVVDADGSTIVNWFNEWGIAAPAEIDFALDTAGTDVEEKCREVIEVMKRASKGAWNNSTTIVGLCGKSFFNKLTKNKNIREVYLNTQNAAALNRAYGVANASPFRSGTLASFEYGGINFVRYQEADNFNFAADEATIKAAGADGMGVQSARCKFFPVNAPGVFQVAFAPAETFDFVNTIGKKLYTMMIRDRDRNAWVRPEVYSYPLYICTRPEMLLRAKESAGA